MRKIEIFELDKYNNDKILQQHANEYKNYCTIRRDLRKADYICQQTLLIDDEIKNDSSNLEKHKNFLPFLQASVLHSIILYTRWFKSTTKKPTLDKMNFFNGNDNLVDTHLKIINIRDKYIAHNELDILGKDRVWVVFNNDEISTESNYTEQL